MEYVSTRGLAPRLRFRDVLMTGLARDGGLYVPADWPELSGAATAGFAGRPYGDVAFDVIAPFVDGEIPDDALRDMIRAAYATFANPAVAPLRELAPDRYLLELFHGPTLAFKDVAMQLLARMMDHVLAARGTRMTIVGATSGDTGAAAIEAFRDRVNVDVFILFPENRVSDFQRRQMTTTGADNVHPIAVKGTFDDCQAIVKAIFGNAEFRDAYAVSGVNSINFARIVGQIVYYFTAAAALGAPDRAVSFTVPTGNFGDIYAGYAAKRMGLPIAELVIATNVNDILARTLATGRYDLRDVTPTTSPSMDIQISSNFERILFEAYDRDAAAIRGLMQGLAETGAFDIAPHALAAIRADFAAGRADETSVASAIAGTYAATGFLPDPHTGVALAVAGDFAEPGVPMVTLSTAHAGKFPAAVTAATGGIAPILPAGFAEILTRTEAFATLAADRRAVEAYIAERSRVSAAESLTR